MFQSYFSFNVIVYKEESITDILNVFKYRIINWG